MAFWDRLLRRKKEIVDTSSVPITIETWNYRSFKGDVLKHDLTVACIDALARNIGKIKLTSIRRTEQGTTQVNALSDVTRVLNRPNPYMSTYDFLYKIAAMYYTSNNVFIWQEYDENGNLKALYPINYQTFHLLKSKNGTLIAQFRLNYFREYTVPYDNLIHLRNHFFSDDLFGDTNAPIGAAIELLNAQNQGIINGIKNSAVIRGILKSVNVIKKEDLNAYREDFIKNNLDASNNGGVIVVDGKFDYTNIKNEPYMVDDKTMAQAKNMVFNYLGVNEEFLQSNFSSEKYEAVYESKIEPFAVMLSEALTYSLLTQRERDFGNEIEATMARLKYQPMTTVTNIITATNQLGLFTRDEYREMLGYEPLGDERGGNEIMIAKNNYEKDSGGSDKDGE